MTGLSKYLALGILLAAPGTANAQTQDAAATREAAQQAYVARDFGEARRILEALLVEAPEDADLHRRIAALDAAEGDLAEAQRRIDLALSLSPLDADIQLARANILFWNKRLAEARQQADRVRQAHGQYPGLAELEQKIAAAQDSRRLRLHSVSAGQTLSRARFAQGETSHWETTRASGSVRWGEASGAAIEVERESRDTVDTRLFGRIDLPAGRHRAFAAASVTPNPDFRENWSLSAGAEFDLGTKLYPQFDARFSEYRAEDVGVVGAGARYQLSEAFSLTARAVNLIGGGNGYRLGGSLRADYGRDQGLTAFVLVASYPDAEVDGTRTLRAIAAGVGFEIAKHLSVRLTSEYETRENSYKRAAFGADLIWVVGAR